MTRTSIDLDYDVAAFTNLVRGVREMHDRAQDVSPAWHALLDWFAEQNFAQWLTRGQRWRTPWQPLAPKTLAEKFRLGFPLDPEIRTGDLVASLVARPLGFENVTPTSVSAGTNVDYAPYQQYGTDTIPARPLFSPAQIRKEQAATSAVANWIIRGERRVAPREEIRGPR